MTCGKSDADIDASVYQILSQIRLYGLSAEVEMSIQELICNPSCQFIAFGPPSPDLRRRGEPNHDRGVVASAKMGTIEAAVSPA